MCKNEFSLHIHYNSISTVFYEKKMNSVDQKRDEEISLASLKLKAIAAKKKSSEFYEADSSARQRTEKRATDSKGNNKEHILMCFRLDN